MEGAHIIDVNGLITSVTRKQQLENSGGKIHEKALIYKMNSQLCHEDEDVYKPNVLPIGPYHHMTTTTIETEKMKWASLGFLLKANPKKIMKEYIKGMEGLEQEIRNSYANQIKLSSYEFLRMMLLDGCCVLLVLHGMEGVLQSQASDISNLEKDEVNSEQKAELYQSIEANGEGDDSPDDTFYAAQWYSRVFSYDLLLVETQIPFFVVLKIYDLFTDGNYPKLLLTESFVESIEDLIYNYPKPINKLERPKEFHHLLHLCHIHFKPTQAFVNNNQAETSFAGQLIDWHRATEYQRTGFTIKKKEFDMDNPHSLLDIKFCNGVLEMPSLSIDPNTYCLFRNLVAFEQTCPQFGNYMTTYVVFLSQFISTPEDVSLLIGRGILVHQLNSDDEICHLFRRLCTGITIEGGDYCLINLSCAMEKHYQIHRSKRKDWLGTIGSKVQQWSKVE